MHTATIRFLTPLLLLSTAIAWIVGGTAWMPIWIANVGLRAAFTPTAMAQLVVGIMTAAALTLVFFGGTPLLGRAMSRACLLAYAFCAVATLASHMAATAASAGLGPLVIPVVGVALSLWLYSTASHAAAASGALQRRSGVWLLARVLAVWVVSIGVAARVPIESNAAQSYGASGGVESVVLDYVHWQGRTVPDTGLSRFLPTLTARTLEGRSIVVLYSPQCGHCRELFEQYFTSARPDVKVIAVEIPPSPGTVALDGDNLGPVPCADCERLSLPPGRAYIIKPPTVIVIEEGRVSCATDSDWNACLGAPPAK